MRHRTCPTCFILSLHNTLMKHVLSCSFVCFALLKGGLSRLYKMLVRAFVTIKCNAHANLIRSTRRFALEWSKRIWLLQRSRVVPRITATCQLQIENQVCSWKELWAKMKVDFWTKCFVPVHNVANCSAFRKHCVEWNCRLCLFLKFEISSKSMKDSFAIEIENWRNRIPTIECAAGGVLEFWCWDMLGSCWLL